MKLRDLKTGDKVKHYCSGEIVEGTIVEVNHHAVITEHPPVRWGTNTYTQTAIRRSTELHRQSTGNEVTPKCWYNEQLITRF